MFLQIPLNVSETHLFIASFIRTNKTFNESFDMASDRTKDAISALLQDCDKLLENLPFPIDSYVLLMRKEIFNCKEKLESLRFLSMLCCILELFFKHISFAMLCSIFSLQVNIFSDRSGRGVVERLIRPTLGDWKDLVKSLSKIIKDNKCHFDSKLIDLSLWALKQNDFDEFVSFRNKKLGHGHISDYSELDGGLDEHFFSEFRRIKIILDGFCGLPFSKSVLRMESKNGPVLSFRGNKVYKKFLENDDFDLKDAKVFLHADKGFEIDLWPFIIVRQTGDSKGLFVFQHWQSYSRKNSVFLELSKKGKFEDYSLIEYLERKVGKKNVVEAQKRRARQILDIDGNFLNLMRSEKEIEKLKKRNMLLDKIAQFVDSNEKGICFITAKPGMGKTAFMSWAFSLEDQRLGYFFQDRIFQDVSNCYECLFVFLSRKYGIEVAPFKDGNEEKLRALLRRLFDVVSKEAQLPEILFFDAIDESDSPDRLLDFLFSDSLPEKIFFVISAREGSVAAEYLENRIPPGSAFLPLSINPEDDENKMLLREYCLEEIPEMDEKTQIDKVLETAGGNFQVLRCLITEIKARLEEGKKAEDILSNLKSIVDSPEAKLNEIYRTYWTRITATDPVKTIRMKRNIYVVAGLLCAARDPLSPSAISEILDLEGCEVENAIGSLSQYLSVFPEADDGGKHEGLNFYHHSFRRFLDSRVKGVKIDLSTGMHDKAFVRYFEGNDISYWSKYGIKNAPSHAISLCEKKCAKAKRYANTALTWLTDYRYIQRCFSDMKGQGLIEKYKRMSGIDSDYLGVLNRFVESIEFEFENIVAYPEITGQQLYNFLCFADDSNVSAICNKWRTNMQDRKIPWIKRHSNCPPVSFKLPIAWNCKKIRENDLDIDMTRNFVSAVRFFDKGKGLAVGFSDGSICLLKTSINEQSQWEMIMKLECSVCSIGFSKDERMLGIATENEILICDICDKDGKPAHLEIVTSLEGLGKSRFSAAGDLIAIVAPENRIEIREFETLKVLKTIEFPERHIDSVCFARNNEFLAISQDKAVVLCNITQKEPFRQISVSCNCELVGFLEEFEILAKDIRRNSLFALDLSSGREDDWLPFHDETILASCLARDGERMATFSRDKGLVVWEMDRQEEEIFSVALKGHSSSVFRLVFASNGKTLASSGGGHRILLWNVENAEMEKALEFGKETVDYYDVSPYGKLIAAGLSNGCVELIHVESGQKLNRLSFQQDNMEWTTSCLRFSPDGRTLAIALFGETRDCDDAPEPEDICDSLDHEAEASLYLWDLSNFEKYGPLKGHSEMITGLCFSPEGQLLVSGADREIIVWNPEVGAMIQIIEDAPASLSSVDFSPDGSSILVSDREGSYFVLDSFSFSAEKPVVKGKEDGSGFSKFYYSPDNDIVENYSNRIVKNNKRLLIRESEISCSAISPDCRYLSVGLKNGQVVVFEFINDEYKSLPVVAARSPEGMIIPICPFCSERHPIHEKNLGKKWICPVENRALTINKSFLSEVLPL